jgi:hypothetical protein
MACCRSKRNCCCRKHGKRSQAPALKSVVTCEKACSQAATAAKLLEFIHSASPRVADALILLGGTVSLPRPPSGSPWYPAFLYQRPPPSFNL